MSVTHQRLATYRALLEDPSHPDAERLHARVRRRLPTISLGTIYKALDTLKALGAILEVDAPRSATRYEASLEPHHHLMCDGCGRIVDLHEPAYARLRPPTRASAGFQITSCTVQFHGQCRKCKPALTRSRSASRRPAAGARQGGF